MHHLQQQQLNKINWRRGEYILMSPVKRLARDESDYVVTEMNYQRICIYFSPIIKIYL